jgi:hypothetical protein
MSFIYQKLFPQACFLVSSREIVELKHIRRRSLRDQELKKGQPKDRVALGFSEIHSQREDHRRLERLAMLPNRRREIITNDEPAGPYLIVDRDKVDGYSF